MSTKSPFVVVEDFLSPLECEDIIARNENYIPNVNAVKKPVKSVKENKLSEIRILPYLKNIMPQLEAYYGFEYDIIKPFAFEWYPQDCEQEATRCENSIMTKGVWRRSNINDFCGIVFLNDYQDTPPFDGDFEVSGGKLSFPNHGFSFNPKRGTLIVFPGEQHFLNFTTSPIIGDAHQIRIHIACEPDKSYKYIPENFKGTFKDWFPDK